LAFKKKKPRKNTRKNGASKCRKRNLKGIYLGLKTLGLLTVIGIFSAMFLFIHDFFTQWDKFNAQKIRIDGIHRLSVEQVMNQAGIQKGMNVLSVNISLCRKHLLAHPWVAKASVQRRLPDTFHIRITEHEPIAVLDLGKQYILSSHGTIFKSWEAADPMDLPHVSGLTFSDLNGPNEPRSAAFSAVLNVLTLSKNKSAFLSNTDIKRIEIDPEIGLTLSVFDGTKQIRLGYNNFATKFKLLEKVFVHLKKDNTICDFEIIDVHDVNRVIVKPIGNETASEGRKEV
jgi:cell division protein FtsQ